MAQALGQDLNGAALQVGKALNDPILGVSALGRAGVQFSESQKEMIRSLVETGRTADAQRIILAELETQSGGSALAARGTLGGALKALNEAFGDLFEITSDNTSGITRLTNRLAFLVGELNENRKALILLAGGVTIAVGALIALAFRAEIAAARIAIMTAAETIAGFVSLARAIGLSAAAMQVLGATGPMRIAGIVIAISAAGAAAYGLKKAIDGSAEAFAEFEKKLAAFDKTAGGGAGGEGGVTGTIIGMTEAVVDQVAALMQLVTLMPVTRVEAGLLAREERTLQNQLAAGNLTYAERLALLTRLQDVQDARAKMQVRLTPDELTQVQFSADRMIGVTPGGRTLPQARGRGAEVPSLDASMKALDADAAKIRARTKTMVDTARLDLFEQLEQARAQFASAIAETLIDSFAAGIERAVATGSIGEGFKALGAALLSGLGSALQMFGKQAIIAAGLMKKFMAAMGKMNPYAAAAAGIAMVALGSVLKGTAQAAFGGGQGGGAAAMGGGLGSLGVGGMQGGTTRFTGTTAGGTGASVTPAQPMQVTIIGPNDAGAQRAIAALMDNAARRGLLQGPILRTT
jgi:hypothetical protein